MSLADLLRRIKVRFPAGAADSVLARVVAQHPKLAPALEASQDDLTMTFTLARTGLEEYVAPVVGEELAGAKLVEGM